MVESLFGVLVAGISQGGVEGKSVEVSVFKSPVILSVSVLQVSGFKNYPLKYGKNKHSKY